MSKKNRSNLDSPTAIHSCPRLEDLPGWAAEESQHLGAKEERELVQYVITHLNAFVEWPARSLLLWPSASRRGKYHVYPTEIQRLAASRSVKLDGRTNGPAIASFLIAGGKRPARVGTKNQWSIHHLYSGKFPHPRRAATLHAAYDGDHMTQSAGLVAVHPVLDAMLDEYPFMSWMLRAEAFRRFGYDPDDVFGSDGPERPEPSAYGREGNASKHGELCIKIVEAELGPKFKKWTGNDEAGHRSHHAVVPLDAPCHIALSWRESGQISPKFIGCFRLNLGGLLEHGYVRWEGTPGKMIRLRFFHADDGRIYIQTNLVGPRLPVGSF